MWTSVGILCWIIILITFSTLSSIHYIFLFLFLPNLQMINVVSKITSVLSLLFSWPIRVSDIKQWKQGQNGCIWDYYKIHESVFKLLKKLFWHQHQTWKTLIILHDRSLSQISQQTRVRRTPRLGTRSSLNTLAVLAKIAFMICCKCLIVQDFWLFLAAFCHFFGM